MNEFYGEDSTADVSLLNDQITRDFTHEFEHELATRNRIEENIDQLSNNISTIPVEMSITPKNDLRIIIDLSKPGNSIFNANSHTSQNATMNELVDIGNGGYKKWKNLKLQLKLQDGEYSETFVSKVKYNKLEDLARSIKNDFDEGYDLVEEGVEIRGYQDKIISKQRLACDILMQGNIYLQQINQTQNYFKYILCCASFLLGAGLAGVVAYFFIPTHEN